MTKIELLSYLTNKAKEYRLGCKESLIKNSHMHDLNQNFECNYIGHASPENYIMNIPQDDIDAILVDFINYIGLKQGVDYALYVSDVAK